MCNSRNHELFPLTTKIFCNITVPYCLKTLFMALYTLKAEDEWVHLVFSITFQQSNQH